VHDLGDVVGGVAGGDLGVLERPQPLVRRELRSALLAPGVVKMRVGRAAATGPASLQLGQRQVRGELSPAEPVGLAAVGPDRDGVAGDLAGWALAVPLRHEHPIGAQLLEEAR